MPLSSEWADHLSLINMLWNLALLRLQDRQTCIFFIDETCEQASEKLFYNVSHCMFTADCLTENLKNKIHLFVIPNTSGNGCFSLAVFKRHPLEQTTRLAGRELPSPDSLSYLPNCSLGLAIFTCVSSLHFSGEQASVCSYHLCSELFPAALC